jgi:hypothetical protein
MAETPWPVSLVISFVPLIVWAGAMWWLARQVRRALTTQDGRSLAEVFDDIARELKRTNELRSGD